jgi:hypothetical protein
MITLIAALACVSGLALGGPAKGATRPTPVASPQQQQATPPNEEFREAGGAADMLQLKGAPPAVENRPDTLKMAAVCTSADGKEFRNGESGYVECMEEYKRGHSLPGSNSDSKGGPGFVIKSP